MIVCCKTPEILCWTITWSAHRLCWPFVLLHKETFLQPDNSIHSIDWGQTSESRLEDWNKKLPAREYHRSCLHNRSFQSDWKLLVCVGEKFACWLVSTLFKFMQSKMINVRNNLLIQKQNKLPIGFLCHLQAHRNCTLLVGWFAYLLVVWDLKKLKMFFQTFGKECRIC